MKKHFLMAAVVAGFLTPAMALAQSEAGAKIDPQMQQVLDALAAMKPKPIDTLDAGDARDQPSLADALEAVMKERGLEAPSMGDVDSAEIDGPDGTDIDLLVYRPPGDGPFPILVYFHGGGWVISDPGDYDASCRALALMANCVVVTAEYRQGPEHPFPAAHEDAYATLQSVMNEAREYSGDPARVAVGGESAGATLATAACIMAKQRGGKMPVHQLLIYPVTDTRMDSESYKAHADAKPLNAKMMAWFFDRYATAMNDRRSALIAPLQADNELLAGLPPATIITAEIDPLRSEGEAYAQKLQSAGVEATHRNFEGVTHEFFGLGQVVDKAREAQAFAAEQLKAAFGRAGEARPQD